MPKFLNTSGITFFLENLISSSKSRVVLVSPYLKINTRIRQLIEDANNSGIEIDFIYGKNDLLPEEEDWLSSLDNVAVRYCENLHAKCYLNESSAIITSMNLYEFSQVNNNEMGVFLDRATDRDCYAEASAEVARLYRISEEHKSRNKTVLPTLEAAEPSAVSPAKVSSSKPAEEIFEKLTTSKMAELCAVKTAKLLEYFLAKGFLELKDEKHFLTDKGKSIGAEVRFGKNGVYFLWPKVMMKRFQAP